MLAARAPDLRRALERNLAESLGFVTRAFSESPLAAAVDLVNQARFLQESSGPCTGCTRPENPADLPAEPPNDHPAEP